MENLRTIREYVYGYATREGSKLSIPAVSHCIRQNWSDWLLPDIAFKIDMIVQAQEAIDRARQEDGFDPYDFIETRNVTETAEKILRYMCDVWTCLGRKKHGHATWSDYIESTRHDYPNMYRNFIDTVVQYIQLRIREIYS